MSKRGRNADYVDSWFATLNSSLNSANASPYRNVGSTTVNTHGYDAYPSYHSGPEYAFTRPDAYSSAYASASGASTTRASAATPVAGSSVATVTNEQYKGPGSAANPIILDLDSPPRPRTEELPPAKRQRKTTAQSPEIINMQPKITPTVVPSYPTAPVNTQVKAQAAPFPSVASSSKLARSPLLVPPPPSVSVPVATPATTGPSMAKGKGKQRVPQPKSSQAKVKPEKRLAIMRKSCSQATRERLERVTLQRFFLVDRKRVDEDLLVQGEMKKEMKEEFKVLGSTGNVYTVVIGRLTKCDCPDAMKGNHCKHILFVFAKVLQVPFDSYFWYQKALLTSELEQIFANAPLAPNDVTNPRVRDAYAQATGQPSAPGVHNDSGKKKPIEEGTECSICYEDMFRADKQDLVFCEISCGNALHKECFGQWAKTKGAAITCPYCRAKWPSAPSVPRTAVNARGLYTEDRYLNLANMAGLNSERDASTYYHGPRRGQRHYGYQNYDDY